MMRRNVTIAVLAVAVLLVGACGASEPSAVVDVVPAGDGDGIEVASAAGCEPGSGPDFGGTGQVDPVYDGQDLRCGSFSRSDLANPSFLGANLAGVDFAFANLADPTFVGADLRGADFTETNLTNPDFTDADLTGASLGSASMTDAVFANTTCPDGRNSDELGGSCLGGLEVAAPGAVGDGTATGGGTGALVSTSGTVGSCAGRYTGSFSGDESGVVAVVVGADGQMITSAYPGFDVTYSDDGFLQLDGDVGSVSIGPDGISVGGGVVVDLNGDGVVIGGDGGVVVDGDGGVSVGGDGGVTVDPDGGVTIGGDDGDGITIDPDGGVSIPGGVTIPGSGGGLSLEPEGPTVPGQGVSVGPGGVAIGGDGGSVVVASGSGQVGDDGLVTIVADDGRVLTGTFDWATCTGGGGWTYAGRNGSWLVAQDTTQVHVHERACDGTTFVGNDADVLIGPGGVAVGTGGVSVGSGAVEVTPNGVSIGSGEVDLDALCLSHTVTDGGSVSYEEVDDSVSIREGDGVVSYGIDGDLLFDFNSAEVDTAAMATIDAVIGSLAARYPGSAIEILGHTDSVGSEGFNIELSQARAQAVAVIVAADQRIAGVQIETFGLGESSPVAPNANADGSDNPAGRAQNRRVEIVVATE